MKSISHEKPLVSVVIPCYNHAQFVKDSIQSVICQDYDNIELIIIDDGSKDKTVEIVKEMIPLCEKRFQRFDFRSRPNKGLSATLNEALAWCKGEYFSPLASDDMALPHKTSFLISKHHQLSAAVIFGSVKKIKSNAESQDLILNCEHLFKDLLFIKNIPFAPASMIRTDVIRGMGGFKEDIALEDLYLWLKITSCGEKMYSFPEVVVKYRDHPSNTIKKFKFMHEQRVKVLDLFCTSSEYGEARKNAIVLGAKAIASEEFKEPFKLVFKERVFNKHGLIIIIKAMTPSKLIKLIRKFV
ncbi:glycosyltransferase [Halomonas sp. I5-271120]|uniref:glycosyltransferase family 2 protein n=1 Tax=Halomonas sp. I5-271120 TaxID=3061632 RepID=UPI0027153193|nr:glycosyltransferase [Halomonas sp. I5-271120]